MTVSTIADSDLPLLLGLNALRKNRGILDLNTLKVHFVGPGEYDLENVLPPGTDTYQGELSPSGHFVLPCCEYRGFENPVQEDEMSLTLVRDDASASTISAPPGLGASSE